MYIAAYLTDTTSSAMLAALCREQDWQLTLCQSSSEFVTLCTSTHPPDVLLSNELAPLLLSDAPDQHRVLLGDVFDAPPGIQVVAPEERQSLLVSLKHGASAARLRHQFSRLDQHEPITRLPRHTELLEQARGFSGTSIGLIALQIDHGEHLYANLDPISKTDLLGHLSDYLQAQLGRNNFLGFFDATCFVVLLGNTTEDETAQCAQTLVSAFAPGIPFRNGTLHVTASAGYSVEARATDPERVWRAAWAAKQSAAKAGGNRALGAPRAQISEQIPRALEREEFSLVLQAQWTADGERLTGVETLLRWQGLEIGELAPSQFIPIAEQSGQMARIGDWVIERACTAASGWLERLLQPIVLGVNVSPQQFDRGVINRQIERLAAERWFDPSMLELELTHDQLLHLVDTHRQHLYQLRDLGVRFALDGLGADLIEAEKLLRCPADTLKLDRSLVARVDSDPLAASLAGEICQLGSRFNLRTVAVGVETETQLETLTQLGCTDVQGYLLSKPVTLQEFQTFLAKRNAATA